MDCKTARLLFDFARPHACELEPADAAALNGHLEQCGDCAAAARAELRFDDAVGAAMRNVTIPVALRQNVLGRLAAERGARHRRQFGHVIRGLAAACLLIGAVWGGYAWLGPGPPALKLEQVVDEANNRVIAPPDAESVAASFRALGVNVPLPANVRWMNLASPPSVTELNGNKVPVLVFFHRDGARYSGAHAYVYILSAKQFDLKKLSADTKSLGGYPYKVSVVRHNDDFAFLIVHTGDDWDWLKAGE
jgi:hypothetical protein